MKKLIIVLIIIFFTAGLGYAQEMKKDGYMMKDGKVWQMKKGKKAEVTTEATLINGTIISVNGNVTGPDGTVRTMKNGEAIYTDGTWSDKINKDNLQNDSKLDKDNIHKDDMPK